MKGRSRRHLFALWRKPGSFSGLYKPLLLFTKQDTVMWFMCLDSVARRKRSAEAKAKGNESEREGRRTRRWRRKWENGCWHVHVPITEKERRAQRERKRWHGDYFGPFPIEFYSGGVKEHSCDRGIYHGNLVLRSHYTPLFLWGFSRIISEEKLKSRDREKMRVNFISRVERATRGQFVFWITLKAVVQSLFCIVVFMSFVRRNSKKEPSGRSFLVFRSIFYWCSWHNESLLPSLWGMRYLKVPFL